MSFLTFLKKRKEDSAAVEIESPKHNPYREKTLLAVKASVNGQDEQIEIKEIRNSRAEVAGAQAIFLFGNEKVPVIVSSPNAESFSIGVNIALHKSLMDDFKEELSRLKKEGLVSPEAKLSYNPDTKNAILFRRSDVKIAGNIQKWKDTCSGNLQTLIDDFSACMPFVLKVYGE